MKTLKSLAIAVSSLCVIPTLAHAKNVSNDAGIAMMRLNASAMSDEIKHDSSSTRVASSQKVHGNSVWKHLRNDFRMAEVNSSLVRSHEYKFATNSAYFNRTLNRSKPYMYHIVQEVKKRGMPAEIALLPFIESAYVTKASSHVGASGLWQFMPATGRHYGLEQTPLYDGRHDVYASTNAALNYLQYLHGLFNDWPLALAAYNWGEGNVTRAVRRAQASGIVPSYENLKMPAETRNYVPKLLAVRNLVSNPQAFGLSLPDIQHSPYFKAVTVNQPVDIMAAAHLANISESEFLSLNPAFKTPVFIPKSGRKMLLPIQAANTFESNYKNNDSTSLLSWDVFTPSYSMTLTEVSEKTGTNVNELRRLNGLNGSHVSAGRSVLVAKNGKNSQTLAMNFVAVDKDNTPDTFVEQTQPVITSLSAPVTQVKVDSSALNKSAKTSPQMVMAQQNFLVVDSANAVPDLAGINSNVAIAGQPESLNSNMNTAEMVSKYMKKATPVAVETVDTTKKTAKVNKVDKSDTTNRSYSPFASVELSAEEMALLDAEINAKSAANRVAEVIDLSNERGKVSADPLLALAQEKARALKEARAAKAKAKREAAEREKAQRLAEAKAKREAAEREKAQRLAETKAKREALELEKAQRLAETKAKRELAEREKVTTKTVDTKVAEVKEAKRKEQEQLRAEKLKQAQELAALRRARESGESITKAIREQKQLTGTTTHRVREGDTLFNIAQRYNLNVSDLVSANNLRGNSIRIGQVLKVISANKPSANNNQSEKKGSLTKVSARRATMMVDLNHGTTMSNEVSIYKQNSKRTNGSRKLDKTKLIPS